MIRVIHSIPEECPECAAENFDGAQMMLFDEGGTVVCVSCGATMILREDEEEAPETSVSFSACPHCCTIGEVRDWGGWERCQACGLDPEREDYGPQDIAHLWKEGTGIRGFMERGIPKRRTSTMFEFLTGFCGPHCSFAESCPQEIDNFTSCRREEFKHGNQGLLQIESMTVSKRRGRNHRKENHQSREGFTPPSKDVAVFECATGGWWDERTMKKHHEIEDPQRPTNTRSGSGT